jgi:glycosyltransferase involved in cell wall biosynthesis
MSVAIKIPLYNAEATILETLDSLLQQTYQDFFIYIYDNASSDNSIKYIESLNDDRIVIIPSEQNRGWNWNFNRCLGVCEHEYLLIAHADDFYHAEFLEKNLEILTHNKPNLLFSKGLPFRNIESISQGKKIDNCLNFSIFNTHEELLQAVIERGNFIFCPTAIGYSKNVITLIKFFDGDRFGGAADLDAWLRFAKEEAIGIIETEGLFFYRLSESQISYHDLSLNNSVFLDCCTYHLNIAVIDSERKAGLEACLKWHKSYYDNMRYLTTLDSYHLPKYVDLMYVFDSNISILRIFKIVGLVSLCKCTYYLPLLFKKKAAVCILKWAR